MSKARTDLIRLAAKLVRGEYTLSEFSEDHPTRARRNYWLDRIEHQNNGLRTLAIELKRIADSIHD